MRVGGGTGSQRWQETKQNEKQQLSQTYTLRTNARHTSRFTPEPSALSVAGPFQSVYLFRHFVECYLMDITLRVTIHAITFTSIASYLYNLYNFRMYVC